MHRPPLLSALLASALLLSCGCHGLDCAFQPAEFGYGADPVLGSCEAYGACGGNCPACAPCQHLKQLLTCGSGCGEIYWGEWISDPPDPCDPCDNCGNWIGPQRCPPGFLHSLAAGCGCLWGYRWGPCASEGAVEVVDIPEVGILGEEEIFLDSGSPEGVSPPRQENSKPLLPVPNPQARRVSPPGSRQLRSAALNPRRVQR